MGHEHADEAREGEVVNDMPANVTPLHKGQAGAGGQPKETPQERKARQKREAEEEKKATQEARAKALVERLQQRRQEREEHEAEPGEGHAQVIYAYELTDLGNADRLEHHYGDVLRYISPWRKWIWFDGGRWQEDRTERAQHFAQETVMKIADELVYCTTPEEMLELLAWYKTSQGSGKISAMLQQARSKVALDPRLLVESMYHLVCANGIVDLRTGQFCDPEETDYSLHWTPVEYHPNAPCPQWDQFITDVTKGEPEMADFLQRVAGYSTVGSSIEQTLLFLTGRGSNGKGVFCRTVSRALGEYAVSVNADFLHKRRYVSHPTDIIQLQGSRFVVVSTELAPGEFLDESRVKTLTGGDFLRGRGIAKDFEQFLPTFSIVAMTNHLPMCKSQDDGWWRRLAVVPFRNQWAPPGREEQMPGLPVADLRLEEKLAEELPGVLRWCIEGARAWCEQGLALPPFVQEATKRYRAGQDPLAAFALAHLVEQQDASARARAVYVAYCRFQAQRGLSAMTETAFGTIMSQRYESKRTDQGKVYLHVRLVEAPQE